MHTPGFTKIQHRIIFILVLPILLSSCEFQCSLGETERDKIADGRMEVQISKLYNGIQLKTNKLNVNKAYLIDGETGERIENSNFVDFTSPVKLILMFDETGWNTDGGVVIPGASETIRSEEGSIILDEKDLFENIDGVTPKDVKVISLTANIQLDKNSPPTEFNISFRVWDKRGPGFVEGSYTLYSK